MALEKTGVFVFNEFLELTTAGQHEQIFTFNVHVLRDCFLIHADDIFSSRIWSVLIGSARV